MKCKKCGRELRAGVRRCPYCGTVVPAPGSGAGEEFQWNVQDFPKPKTKSDLSIDWGAEKIVDKDSGRTYFQQENAWKEPDEVHDMFRFDTAHENLQQKVDEKVDDIAAEKPRPAVEMRDNGDLFSLPDEMSMDDLSDLLGTASINVKNTGAADTGNIPRQNTGAREPVQSGGRAEVSRQEPRGKQPEKKPAVPPEDRSYDPFRNNDLLNTQTIDVVPDFLASKDPSQVIGTPKAEKREVSDPGYTEEEEKRAVENFQNLINAEENFADSMGRLTFMSEDEEAKVKKADRKREELTHIPDISFRSIEDEYERYRERHGNEAPSPETNEKQPGVQKASAEGETASPADIKPAEATREPAPQNRHQAVIHRREKPAARIIMEESGHENVRPDTSAPVSPDNNKKKNREVNIKINEPTGTKFTVKTQEINLADEVNDRTKTQKVDLNELKKGPQGVQVQVEVNSKNANSSVEVTRRHDGATVVKTLEDGREKERTYDADGRSDEEKPAGTAPAPVKSAAFADEPAAPENQTEEEQPKSFWEQKSKPATRMTITDIFGPEAQDFKQKWEGEENGTPQDNSAESSDSAEGKSYGSEFVWTRKSSSPISNISKAEAPVKSHETAAAHRPDEHAENASELSDTSVGNSGTASEEVPAAAENAGSDVKIPVKDEGMTSEPEILQSEDAGKDTPESAPQNAVETEADHAAERAADAAAETEHIAVESVSSAVEAEEKTDGYENTVSGVSETGDVSVSEDTDPADEEQPQDFENAQAAGDSESADGAPEVLPDENGADASAENTDEAALEGDTVRIDLSDIKEIGAKPAESEERPDQAASQYTVSDNNRITVSADTEETENEPEAAAESPEDQDVFGDQATDTERDSDGQAADVSRETIPADAAVSTDEPVSNAENNSKKYEDITLMLSADEIKKKAEEEAGNNFAEENRETENARTSVSGSAETAGETSDGETEEPSGSQNGKTAARSIEDISFTYVDTSMERRPEPERRKPVEKTAGGREQKPDEKKHEEKKAVSGSIGRFISGIKEKAASGRGNAGKTEESAPDGSEEFIRKNVSTVKKDTSTGSRIMKIVIIVLIAAIILEFAIIGVKLFAPDSQGAVFINRIERSIAGEEYTQTTGAESSQVSGAGVQDTRTDVSADL